MSDTTRRRLTIRDLPRKPFVDLTQQESPRPAPIPAKVAPPPPAPGVKTAAQIAKRKRHKLKWQRKHQNALRPQVEELLQQLQARYPASFTKGAPKPLAIGIHRQIQAELGCSSAVLKIAMHIWCSQPAYLANVTDQSHRHDLDGAPVAELTAEERARAATRLAALQAMLKLRAQTQRQSR